MSETKNNILEKSLTLFMQKSYKEVSLRDIVDATGLSKGAFYHHFKSKEQVYEECVRHFYSERLISDYTRFPRTTLKEFYLHYLEELRNERHSNENISAPSSFVFMLESSQKIPSFREIHEGQRRKELDEWIQVIEQAKASNEIRGSMGSKEIAQLFLNVSDGIVLNHLFNPQPQKNIIEETCNCWENLYGLLTRK